jgi:molecular chaperone GrpE
MSKEHHNSKSTETVETVDTAPEATAEAAPLTPAQIEELKAQAAKAAEHWDRLVRSSADLENYKKRAARERQDAIKYASESLMHKLLPILDNFEAALAAVQASNAEGNNSLLTGVSMIQQQLKSVLTEAGLEEIEAHGKPFDPNFHEAVSQSESAEHPEGNVMQQLRKGYRLRDRLLRPATVVVSKGPGEAK